MANIYWSGNQRATARSYAVTVTASAVSGTLTATINSKTETYTATSTSTADAAAGFATALTASLVPELANFTFSADGSVVTATGPADGMPLAITWGSAGGTTQSSTTVPPTSPHDVSAAANWVGGVLPVNLDTAVFENSPVSALYNLAAFTANTVSVVRRASHTGQVGLPDTNPLGYPEFLATHFETAGTGLTVEDNGQAFVRLKSTAVGAVTAVVTGDQGGALGQEMVEVTGTPAASVLNQNGGSLAVAPLTSQAAVLATVRAANGVLRTGPGCVLTTATLIGMQAEVGGNYTSLTADRDAQVSVTRAATAATGTTVEGGAVNWNSTGGPGAVTVGSGGTLDLSRAPATVTPGTITVEEGATLLDPNERLVKPYNLVVNGQIENMTLDLGTRFNLAVS